jgi:hypothetical protein
MSADSFRLLPKESETTSVWTATKWAETRRGWIFITSRPTMREALRPLISLWIDTLVLRLLNEPMPDQKPVWFVIDELASLQRLGSNDVRGLQALATAVGKNWVRGVVLYTGADTIPFSANLHGIPIRRLWSA